MTYPPGILARKVLLRAHTSCLGVIWGRKVVLAWIAALLTPGLLLVPSAVVFAHGYAEDVLQTPRLAAEEAALEGAEAALRTALGLMATDAQRRFAVGLALGLHDLPGATLSMLRAAGSELPLLGFVLQDAESAVTAGDAAATRLIALAQVSQAYSRLPLLTAMAEVLAEAAIAVGAARQTAGMAARCPPLPPGPGAPDPIPCPLRHAHPECSSMGGGTCSLNSTTTLLGAPLEWDAASRRWDRIPRIVHQTWKTAHEVPAQWVKLASSWRARGALPRPLARVLWGDEALPALARLVHVALLQPQWLLAAAPPVLSDAWYFAAYERNIERADAIRYHIMTALGGVYADMDISFRARDRWNVLFREPSAVIAHGFGEISCRAQEFFLSSPGHVFFGRLVRRLPLYASTSLPLHRLSATLAVFCAAGPTVFCAEYRHMARELQGHPQWDLLELHEEDVGGKTGSLLGHGRGGTWQPPGDVLQRNLAPEFRLYLALVFFPLSALLLRHCCSASRFRDDDDDDYDRRRSSSSSITVVDDDDNDRLATSSAASPHTQNETTPVCRHSDGQEDSLCLSQRGVTVPVFVARSHVRQLEEDDDLKSKLV
jgi:mannosyltransferase OCH1-like enzyme